MDKLEAYCEAQNDLLDAEAFVWTTAEELGKYLRSYRIDKDIKLREMARRLGVSAPFLYDLELGRRKPSERICDLIEKFYI